MSALAICLSDAAREVRFALFESPDIAVCRRVIDSAAAGLMPLSEDIATLSFCTAVEAAATFCSADDFRPAKDWRSWSKPAFARLTSMLIASCSDTTDAPVTYSFRFPSAQFLNPPICPPPCQSGDGQIGVKGPLGGTKKYRG